ncbi:MAG TPA: carbohydrate porin [Steroidobacteraceae bacterium]|nr:carbohydrate porin [Steroidobacteraceae bacterium]
MLRLVQPVAVAILLCASVCNAEPIGGEEPWNAFGQATYIWNEKRDFPALYTNLNGTPNSLIPENEHSYTFSATAFLGLRTWKGGEIYLAPEVISELPLSGLHGLGGSIQNAELQKTGGRAPTLYVSRVFVRQSLNLGGTLSSVASAPLQLGGTVDSRRVVLTAGNLSILDIFDKNAFAGDVRQQFFSMNFLTHSAYDFAADARGYTWGVAGELYYDDWAFRIGRFATPREPNQLLLDSDIFRFYGDQIELERRFLIDERPGKLRLLAYRNRENMGRWDDAIAALQADPTKNAASCTAFNYGSSNTSAPDLCWVRKPNVKMGVGINLEQRLRDDIGIFVRGMVSDGKTEVYSFVSSDQSVSLGTVVQGKRWGRPRDTVGLGYARNWISGSHAAYHNMGGIDGFIGDGRLRYRPEQAVEIYYSSRLHDYLWVSLDYQHISNPAYNADRGPVDIIGVRVHTEF